jgi:hypothetical protein
MGRQRLYHTAEEKLAANRAKSKRHYEKYVLFLIIHYIDISDEHSRAKISINKCRRRKYQKMIRKR